MSATEVLRTEHSWIQKTPGVCGGDACIRTTRVAVWLLVVARKQGASDADLLNYFVTPLTLADVHAAWSYYGQFPTEIDQAIREQEET
jgi:uncharacterized protein (DUF433 family)